MTNARQEALATIADLARTHDLTLGEISARLAAGAPVPDEDSPGSYKETRAAGILARVLAYLGGVLILAGIGLFIGLKWEQWSSPLRVLMTLGAGFALYLLALASVSDRRFAQATTPLFLVSAALQPTGLLVLLNEYGGAGRPDHAVLFMCVVMFVQQFLTFLALRRTVLLFVSLVFGSFAYATFCDILRVDVDIVTLTLGIALSALAWTLERSAHRVLAPVTWFCGSGLFLAGSFGLLEHTALEILFFGLGAGVMYLGAAVRSRALLLVSVIALTAFTAYYFADSLGSALGLIVIGLVLIGLSALALRLGQRFTDR
jgi:hypothetical protein